MGQTKRPFLDGCNRCKFKSSFVYRYIIHKVNTQSMSKNNEMRTCGWNTTSWTRDDYTPVRYLLDNADARITNTRAGNKITYTEPIDTCKIIFSCCYPNRRYPTTRMNEHLAGNRWNYTQDESKKKFLSMSASIKTTKLERRKINNEVWNATIQFLLWVIGADAESRGRGGAGREERPLPWGSSAWPSSEHSRRLKDGWTAIYSSIVVRHRIAYAHT